MIATMPKDLKTRYQGVFARHQKNCRLETGGERCNCTPSYYGVAYDRAASKPVRTRRMPTAEIARNARNDLLTEIQTGQRPTTNGLRLKDARERFVTAAREGKALNKRGKRYKPSAIDNIEISIRTHVEPTLARKRLTDIRRGDVQAIIDEMTTVRSGSRVRNVVNSIRALYAWAQDRELASHDPAQRVRLPAMDATPITRIATPAEFEQLLTVLEIEDACAYGLAGYAGARAQQIRHLRWKEIDLAAGSVELGAEWEAAKYEASHRVVPLIPMLLSRLKRLHIKRGRPAGDEFVFPARMRSRTGLMSLRALGNRAAARWKAAHLNRITLQEARHSCATWLDAAGVSPRIASYWMGHAVPKHQPGAAVITLARYTHALSDDVATASGQFAKYLAAAQKRRAI